MEYNLKIKYLPVTTTYFRTKHHGDYAEPTSGGSWKVAVVTEATAEDVVHTADFRLAAEREQIGEQVYFHKTLTLEI